MELTMPHPHTAVPAVVAIVRVRAPRFVPRALIRRKMRATLPQYQHLHGLAWKAFTISDDGYFGGAYLWTDRASAESWFDSSWHARVRRERGVEGHVRIFDAPVVLVNEPDDASRVTGGDAVVTVSLLPTPEGVTRDRVIAGFTAAVPAYRTVPGLLRKYFVISADGSFGGVYIWRSRSAAEQYFSVAWHEKARTTHGAIPTLEMYSAPILAPSAEASNHVTVVR
jgi:hypothetical protein